MWSSVKTQGPIGVSVLRTCPSVRFICFSRSRCENRLRGRKLAPQALVLRGCIYIPPRETGRCSWAGCDSHHQHPRQGRHRCFRKRWGGAIVREVCYRDEEPKQGEKRGAGGHHPAAWAQHCQSLQLSACRPFQCRHDTSSLLRRAVGRLSILRNRASERHLSPLRSVAGARSDNTESLHCSLRPWTLTYQLARVSVMSWNGFVRLADVQVVGRRT
mmetsp:Transcript_31206/g.48335  ORF Transcript_31206/g.48335 Transcript_31206/m.48335 type:complete len:216 (+) Transcript_31206:417-1064(+)